MSHDIKAAMERGELTEEEAFFVLRFAGNLGYDRAIRRMKNPLKVLRRWFVWIGGWETAELSQWDRGKKPWELFGSCGSLKGPKRYIKSPFSVSLFGRRITCFGWGIQVKTRRGYLCASSDYAGGLPTKLYWSPNGTPGHPEARMYWRKKCKATLTRKWGIHG